jgi:hypothetical protein
VATLQLNLSVVFDVSALGAGISAGRLVALHSGRCDITATLTIQGTTVITRHAHLELPGIIPLSPEIRLLPARNYPVGAEQAESADDGLAQRTAAGWEDTIQLSPILRGPGTEHRHRPEVSCRGVSLAVIHRPCTGRCARSVPRPGRPPRAPVSPAQMAAGSHSRRGRPAARSCAAAVPQAVRRAGPRCP